MMKEVSRHHLGDAVHVEYECGCEATGVGGSGQRCIAKCTEGHYSFWDKCNCGCRPPPGDQEYNKARKLADIRRLVWEHVDSGSIPIMGEGLASNKLLLTEEDADWLNAQLPTLKFTVQRWDGDDWVEVSDG